MAQSSNIDREKKKAKQWWKNQAKPTAQDSLISPRFRSYCFLNITFHFSIINQYNLFIFLFLRSLTLSGWSFQYGIVVTEKHFLLAYGQDYKTHNNLQLIWAINFIIDGLDWFKIGVSHRCLFLGVSQVRNAVKIIVLLYYYLDDGIWK